jgi:hypothetical protein
MNLLKLVDLIIDVRRAGLREKSPERTPLGVFSFGQFSLRPLQNFCQIGSETIGPFDRCFQRWMFQPALHVANHLLAHPTVSLDPIFRQLLPQSFFLKQQHNTFANFPIVFLCFHPRALRQKPVDAIRHSCYVLLTSEKETQPKEGTDKYEK